MTVRTRWHPIPRRRIGPEWAGRATRAYAHPNGGLLVHYRPPSRNARWHRRVGLWVLAHGGTLVKRQGYYGRPVRNPPLLWANKALREHLAGNRPPDDMTADRHPPLAEVVASTPLGYDELPPVLVGRRPKSQELQRDLSGAPVPTALPTVPPERTVTGRHAKRVLCQEEYALYAAVWSEWLADHPEFTAPGKCDDLHVVCMEGVLLHRINCLMACRPGQTARLLDLYHRAWWRQQRARERLGATRNQRCTDLAERGIMNIAVVAGQISRHSQQ